MGFLTKLFGKKNRNEDIPAEELPAEQAGEDPDGEGALTAEEEAAAEAAEQAFFAEHPEIAGEDILDEELRLEQEQQEREAAEEAESADSTGSAGNAEDVAEPAEEPAEEPVESEPADAPAEAVAAEDTTTKKSFWGRLRAGLTKTRNALFAPVDSLLRNFTKVDEDLLEELEEILISADVGMTATEEILDQLRDRIRDGRLKEKEQVMDALREIMTGMIGESQPLRLETSPSVILVIGVNGAGKTTSIGKISKRLKLQGKRVVVAAADTFRAAAAEQLSVWAERAGVPIIKHGEGADPAAVVFDAIASFKAKGCDLLLCDTAGRLHNKKNLMSELEKIRRVIARELPGVHTEVLLVLDATTGQNAIAQARVFGESAGLTGVVLTKLDGTAKGGMTVAIKQELGLPVRFVGVGEGIDDLQPFDADAFARALIGA